jgi:hypothetical protein
MNKNFILENSKILINVKDDSIFENEENEIFTVCFIDREVEKNKNKKKVEKESIEVIAIKILNLKQKELSLFVGCCVKNRFN